MPAVARAVLRAGVALAAIATSGLAQRPDLIVTGARLFTADSARPWAEALAVRGERIVAVGTSAEILALRGPQTRQLYAGGRTLIPGINDSHVHLGEATLGATFATSDASLAGPTMAEVVDSLRAIAARTPRGTWLQGSLGQRILADANARRAALDAVTPDHPVILRAPWGHGIVVNSMALKVLGIAEDARSPVGGRYERDASGRLTGALVEYAGWGPVQRAQSRQSLVEAAATVRHELDARLPFGVTSVQAMASTWDAAMSIRVLREAAVPMRVRVVRWPMTDAGGRRLAEWKALPAAPAPRIRVAGWKYVLEGTPQEQGALNIAPYAGRSGWFGELNFPLDTVRAMLREALAGTGASDQLLLHIVGDSTVRLVLDAMQSLSPDSVWRTKRVRFEHASRLNGPLIARAHAMGVMVAQPRGSASYRSWMAAGIPVAYGSDGPPNPFVDFAAAVTMPNRPAEAISREDAARILTAGPAMAEWTEGEKGRLSVGMLADFAVLSQDIFTVPAAALPATRSELTVIGGRIAYSSGAVAPSTVHAGARR
jgi:predicted amidohydrolase YtcJ